MIDTITYLVAPHANAVEIVLMAFPTPDEARRFCLKLGLRGARPAPGQSEKEWWECEYEPVPEDEPVNSFSFAYFRGEYVSLAYALENEYNPNDEGNTPLANALCKGGHYDHGNGEMYRIDIRTVPIGSPVVAWDFD